MMCGPVCTTPDAVDLAVSPALRALLLSSAPPPRIRTTPLAVIKDLVDLLVDLDIEPLHLYIDARAITDIRPFISLWLRTHPDFTRVCEALAVVPSVWSTGQKGRQWTAEKNTDNRRLLVSCVEREGS